MLHKEFELYDVVLASGSPRRQELLTSMGIPHRVEVRKIEEIYPDKLKGHEITDYLAHKKADAFQVLNSNQIIITSDTIVWFEGRPVKSPVTEIMPCLCSNLYVVKCMKCLLRSVLKQIMKRKLFTTALKFG